MWLGYFNYGNVKELVLLSEVNQRQTQALKAGSLSVGIIYSGSLSA